MTELEKIQRAKMYIDKMANGINPITDEQTVDDDTLNNVLANKRNLASNNSPLLKKS